jgi:hypothetical protein
MGEAYRGVDVGTGRARAGLVDPASRLPGSERQSFKMWRDTCEGLQSANPRGAGAVLMGEDRGGGDGGEFVDIRPIAANLGQSLGLGAALSVMAGPVPAIPAIGSQIADVDVCRTLRRMFCDVPTWMPATSADMTEGAAPLGKSPSLALPQEGRGLGRGGVKTGREALGLRCASPGGAA